MNDAKRCPTCSEVKPLTEFYRDKSRQDGLTNRCKECVRESVSRYHTEHIEKRRESNRRWRKANPDKVRKIKRRYRKAAPETEHESRRRRRERIRDAILDHYGRSCACCGAMEKLSIDHINGDGKQHRVELYGREDGSARLYHWLADNGFPSGFQVLCTPCNSSKGNRDHCRLDHTAAKADAA